MCLFGNCNENKIFVYNDRLHPIKVNIITYNRTQNKSVKHFVIEARSSKKIDVDINTITSIEIYESMRKEQNCIFMCPDISTIGKTIRLINSN